VWAIVRAIGSCAGRIAATLICGLPIAGPGTVHAQQSDRELVATISGPLLRGGIVSELAWHDGVLIIQSAAMNPDGTLKPSYYTTAARDKQVTALAEAPAGLDRYWNMKASRVSPTGLGRITSDRDAQMPMYGVASLEERLRDGHIMGGTVQTHVLRLYDLVLHRRSSDIEPYDGEVWSWSPAELNRIAYVDGKGDLWIARADGRSPERVQKGTFTLPAWSEDGRTLAVAERKDGGRRWEVSVLHLRDKHRRP
jgi:hypothetical protein